MNELIPFEADGYSAPYVAMLAIAITRGKVVSARVGRGTRVLSIGPYKRATGPAAWAMLDWPHGRELVIGDAFDVASAFFAQLNAESFNLAWHVAQGSCRDEQRIYDAFSEVA